MTLFSNFVAIVSSQWSKGLTLAIAILVCLPGALKAQGQSSGFATPSSFPAAANQLPSQTHPSQGFPTEPVHFDPSVQSASAVSDSMSGSAGPESNPVSEMSGAWTNLTTMIQQQWQQSGWAEKAKGWTGDFDLGRMLGSLSIVLGGYFGLVALMRWINPSRGGVPTEVLELLGTVPLAPRKQLQIVRLGSKLLLLVDSDEGTHPIGEISDPEEVEYLASLCPGRNKSGRSLVRRLSHAATQRVASTGEPNGTVNQTPAPANQPATSPVNPAAESHLAALLQSLSRNPAGANQSGPAVFEA